MHFRKDSDQYGARIFFLAVISICLIGLITVRLFVLQVVSGVYWLKLAEAQHENEQVLVATRGEIFIRERGSTARFPLVANVNRPRVYVVPQHVTDPRKLADELAPILGANADELLKKISDHERKYVPVAREVSEAVALEIAGRKLAGVYFENETHQTYPEGKLAAQVLGFVAYNEANERVGRYGIEQQFESDLAGTPGRIQGTKDPRGNLTTAGDRVITPPRDGINLVLTLDRAIQHKVEAVLSQTVTAHRAKSGSVIVMDPSSGAILAMASYPTFDPNRFGEVSDPQLFNNLAIQFSYEPGSIAKALTMAGALDAGVVTPDMKFTDQGSVTLEKFTIRNAQNKTYGEVTMTEVLRESINTGAIFAEQKMGHQKFRGVLQAFGLGATTGIELPFESKGSIENMYKGGDLYPATASFGQGITATPLQMVTDYAAIANGGRYYKPFIVAEKEYSDGRIEKTQKTLVRPVIAPATASTLGAMLVSVVEEGHGKRAGVPGYFIAGKTGTAQIAHTSRAGYDPNRTIGSFVGFGPVDDPRFVMIVKIDEPQDVTFAESTAAPAFGEIAAFILNYYQVPKTR